MKFKDSHILDYLDNQLCEQDCDNLESHLEQHQDTSDAVDDARLAMLALHDLAQEEPVKVSEDFWPRLREHLPELPSRNPLSQFASNLSQWVWPTSSKWAISARVALLVTVLAMASLWLGPQRTVAPSSAAFSDSEKAFIARSMQRHEDYVNTPPSVNSLPLPFGDATSSDQNAAASDDVYMP